MWEIPLFKFFENKKVKKEIEKSHPGKQVNQRFVGMKIQQPAEIQTSKAKKKVPGLAKAIAIGNWIGSGFSILGGILLIVASSMFAQLAGAGPEGELVAGFVLGGRG